MIFAKNDNGTIRIYRSLPTNYPINGIRHNLSVLPIETINTEGFYELIVPSITQYQRLESLIPSDFNGTQWIQRVYNFTAQEIADYDEQQIENQTLQLIQQRESDGNAFFYKVVTAIKRRYDEGNLTNAQYKNIRSSLKDVLLPLKFGDWDLAQDAINAINRPSGAMGVLYDFLKNKIDSYVLDNY